MNVATKPNPRRAAILACEADVAAAAGRTEVEAWLRARVFAYLVGQTASA